MKQNKTDYEETWPHCIQCNELMLHKSGEVVSIEAYEGLKGICNDCDMKGVLKNEKA